jgi:hypothetical protein
MKISRWVVLHIEFISINHYAISYLINDIITCNHFNTTEWTFVECFICQNLATISCIQTLNIKLQTKFKMLHKQFPKKKMHLDPSMLSLAQKSCTPMIFDNELQEF